MGDDLDDLLDEVEQKFLSESSQKTTVAMPTPIYKPRSELDSIIDEIMSGDSDKPVFSKQKQPNKAVIVSASSRTLPQPSCSSSEEGHQRCFQVLLGGSDVVMGINSAGVPRACDQLRCTSCDFRVLSFKDHAWHKNSDYLFFRNNVPDYERLKKNLVWKKGSRAYACQCSWQSVVGTLELISLQTLKWVCGKHT